jgi:hypothetical protein
MVTFNRILCLFIIAVIIGFTTPADATQRLKYTGIARSTGGAVLGSATVTIYLAGTTTAANVYEASSGGDSVTSVTSDSNGRWTFYADVADYAFTQEYKVVVTKDGYSTITLDNIFNLSLPTNAVGVLTNDGSGNYTWSAASFSESGDYSPTGTWDWSGATVSGLNATGLKLADDSTLTLPTAAVDEGWTTGLLGFGPDGTGIFVNIADLEATIPISGEVTDEQVACWESSETPGTNKLKSCGAKTTDNSTATHLLCKDDSGEIENCTLAGLAISGTTSPTITVEAVPSNATVNAAGEVTIDTTTDQIRWYGTAQQQLSPKLTFSVVVPSVADTDDMLVMKAPYGMTITALDCIVSAATSATINIQECDSAGANCVDTATSDLACDTDGANTTTLNNAVVDSGDWLKLDVASISGTPGTLTVTVTYTIVAD